MVETTDLVLQELMVQTVKLQNIESALTTILVTLFGILAVYLVLKWRNRRD